MCISARSSHIASLPARTMLGLLARSNGRVSEPPIHLIPTPRPPSASLLYGKHQPTSIGSVRFSSLSSKNKLAKTQFCKRPIPLSQSRLQRPKHKYQPTGYRDPNRGDRPTKTRRYGGSKVRKLGNIGTHASASVTEVLGTNMMLRFHHCNGGAFKIRSTDVSDKLTCYIDVVYDLWEDGIYPALQHYNSEPKNARRATTTVSVKVPMQSCLERVNDATQRQPETPLAQSVLKSGVRLGGLILSVVTILEIALLQYSKRFTGRSL